jgi:hypothetical protein
MALALILASAATASAQSLADISRQEEERRKTIGTPGKVYTNDRLRPEPPPRGVPTSAPGTVAPETPTESQTTDSGAPGDEAATPADQTAGSTDIPRTEEDWRKRVAAERDAVSRAQILAEALQSRINAVPTDFENRDDPAQRSVIATDRQKALAELDRVKKEVLEHQKAVIAIQEQARRAGVPAGWTR